MLLMVDVSPWLPRDNVHGKYEPHRSVVTFLTSTHVGQVVHEVGGDIHVYL